MVEEERGDDRSGEAAASGIVDVGDVGVEETPVVAPDRHAPHRIVERRRALEQALGELLVVAEQGGKLRAEGDARGAGERGEIDQRARFRLGGVRERIGEDDAALRVGIADLHRDSRTVRIARDRVLDGGNEHLQAHGQLALHDEARERDRVRRAAHVLLHEAHAVVGLQVEPAGIEAHALADHREARMLRVAPANLEQARRTRGGASHGVDRGEVLRQQIVADPFVEFAAEEVGLFARVIGELLGPHVLGGRVDEVAHQPDGLRHVERLGNPP